MSKKKKSPKTWIFIVVAAVLIAALVIYKLTNKKEGIVVEIGHPSISTIVESIPANGKIQPVTEVKISPDVSGEIIELNYEEGDYVKKGDLIIKIKQDVYISLRDRAIASLNSIKAQYTQQQAQLRQIELSYNRNKTLYEQKAISQSDYETAISQYEVAKEQLKAAEYNVQSANASLKEAEENLIKTIIYAPMDGIISKLSVERGERVVGTSQMAGTEMLRIANLDKMEVLVDVNENDIIRIKEKDTATIDVDAYPNRVFKGIVTQIANSAKNIGSTTEQVTNFEVKVEILPDSYRDIINTKSIPFRPGMSASVQIITEKKENILTVPLQAVTTKIGAEGEYVYVYSDSLSTVKAAKIITGIQDINNIEIIDGIDQNTSIVTGPYSTINKTLKDDLKVTSSTKK